MSKQEARYLLEKARVKCPHCHNVNTDYNADDIRYDFELKCPVCDSSFDFSEENQNEVLASIIEILQELCDE